MGGWKTEHSKTDFAATLMQIILVYYLWARVNQHPPTHHEGWMISGSPRTHSGLFKWVFVFENVSPAEFSLLQFRDFINSKEIPDTFVRFLIWNRSLPWRRNPSGYSWDWESSLLKSRKSFNAFLTLYRKHPTKFWRSLWRIPCKLYLCKDYEGSYILHILLEWERELTPKDESHLELTQC
jgi:hypothetical protein